MRIPPALEDAYLNDACVHHAMQFQKYGKTVEECLVLAVNELVKIRKVQHDAIVDHARREPFKAYRP